LEGADLEKGDDEDGGDEEGVERLCARRLFGPGDKVFHLLRGRKRRARSEEDADLFTVPVEGEDNVREGLVEPPVTLVADAVPEEHLVELADGALCRAEVIKSLEDEVHRFCIARHFLFVAGGEGPRFEVRKKRSNSRG